jgi:hypothetical protein
MFILIGPHVRHVKKINHGLPLCQNNVNGVNVKKKITTSLRKRHWEFTPEPSPEVEFPSHG